MNDDIFSIEEVKKKIEIFENYDSAKEAYLYFKELKEFIEVSKLKEIDQEQYRQYDKLLMKLKFLALNCFDDWDEIKDLIKNYFELSFGLKYYSLWDKIKIHLLTMPNLDDRDRIKGELKEIILTCDRDIIDKKKYRDDGLPGSVMDWIKEYNVNLGTKEVDNLKRLQYFTDNEKIKKLDERDKYKVKTLFDFYENLKASSSSPKGFEGDIPMVIEGKRIIFSGGEAREIGPDITNLIRSIKLDGEADEAKVVEINKNLSEGDRKKFQELREIAEQFPLGSLQRRAIEEEIKKLGEY